jgi:hypothetical protein
LVWTPSTAINDTAINDVHSTIAIHPFPPLRLLKPPTSSHSPFHPLLIAILPNEAATTLEAITALLRNCITSNPQVRETPALAIAVNQTAV